MKIADLYIRVSTDEQADKGYSQRHQEEVLVRYCQSNGIKVRKIIFEDHSAKTFERPQWRDLLVDLKRKKKQTNLILFTKWDRFSRNAPEAYQMISTLARLGIEPQAVDQPLDLSIPENKLMLAIYLSTPEIENDRRALNVTYGMRRAKKEGRWMGTAPVGYTNKTQEDGTKYIAPKEPEASIMKWVFEEISHGQLSADQVRKVAVGKGLKCSRSNFWNQIRNPVYCGKIFIPKHKDEESAIVPGKHEPIISERLFYDVQDVLLGRKRSDKVRGTTIASPEELPLRGFLICKNCGLMLTGSASKGNGGYYYYYHCNSKCGCRYKAPFVNDLFVKELKKYVPQSGMIELYQHAINVLYCQQTQTRKDERTKILAELEEQNKKLNKARMLLLTDDLDPADYKEIKAVSQETIMRLEAKLTDTKSKTESIDELLDKVLHNLSNLDTLYEEGDMETRRTIIGSMFPEKLTFDGFQHRTNRINEAAKYIYLINNSFRENENGTSGNVLHLSRGVASTGIEPVSKV